MPEGAGGRGTKCAENRLTLAHSPDPIVAMLDEVGQKLFCGLAEQSCTMESSAEMVHLAADHTILYALSSITMWGARHRSAFPGMASFLSYSSLRHPC